MNILASSIVEVLMNKKALWILVDVDVSTAERAIIASNEKFELFPIICRIQNLVQHIQ